MKNNKSSLMKVATLVLTLGLLGVSETSFAYWDRNCRINYIGGVRIQTCDRVWREGWREHRRWDNRRWDNRRYCKVWYDHWGRIHRDCRVR